MSILQELSQSINQLSKYEDYDSSALDVIEKAANTIGQSWSGSWLGYQSRIYYADFQQPSPEATFSKMWGFSARAPTRGNWREYTPEEVTAFIYKQTDNSSTHSYAVDSKEAVAAFEEAQQSVLSLVYANYNLKSNKFMANLVDKIESLEISTEDSFIVDRRPSGEIDSRDLRATNEGLTTPPHIIVLSTVHAIRASFQSCKDLKKQIVNLVDHIQNLEISTIQENKIGDKIFIGHGRSPHWREFKDFINDRLELPWDEW